MGINRCNSLWSTGNGYLTFFVRFARKGANMLWLLSLASLMHL